LEYINNDKLLNELKRSFRMLNDMDEKVNSNNIYPFEFNNGQNHKDVKYTVTNDGYIIMLKMR